MEIAADEAAEDWDRLVSPMTDPIIALIDRAGSLEEIRSGLLAVEGVMNATDLREELARGLFSARLAGDASVGRETEEEVA
jgi:phage gp29-like protein